MYKFLIADDHPLFREALKGSLSSCYDSVSFFESDSLDTTIEVLRKGRKIDLIILDLNMPGCDNFYGLLRVKQSYPDIPVVVLSASDSTETIAQVMEFGANAFIPKTTPTSDIKKAIDTVLAGSKWLPDNIEEALVHVDSEAKSIANRLRELTPKQFKVLKLVKDGMMNKQIADALNVTEATVKAHIGVIFKKLGVKTRTQIVLAVEKLKLD
ncbi:MAG: response regulator transcription factor [Glaciecola sp.]|jgi:DNA-binding NarL/FixJ family response regulator